MRTNRLDDSINISNDGDIFCERCGQNIPYSTWAKCKQRNNADWAYCVDCRAKPIRTFYWTHPILGKIYCHPYTGELDDLWRPINSRGDLHMAGERICGHKDCVNSKHVVGASRMRTK
jgi:hypothetical protein